MMDSSRIFIRGLPPSMSDEQFQSHFATFSPAADARFIPHRRIGYVGYKSSETARNAVKHFNKSFIGMSRLKVELAKPYSELKGKKNAWDTQDEPRREKRKHDRQNRKFQDKKLGEYMEIMTAPAQVKVWSNGDIQSSQKPLPIEDLQKSTEELQCAVTSLSKEVEAPGKDGTFVGSPLPPEQAIESTPFNDISEEKNSTWSEPPVSTASNSDWLRAKTSRALGLLNDHEIEAELCNQTRDDAVKPLHQSMTGQDEKSRSSAENHEIDVAADEGEPIPNIVQAAESVHSSRLFVRNLSYDITEDILMEFFSMKGPIEEIHVPTDIRLGQGKGYAYVQYSESDDAEQALRDLDGQILRGRLIHIIPASAKRHQGLDDYTVSQLPVWRQTHIRRKAEASSATFRWNSMYMNLDAIMSSISERLGLSKSEVLDPTSSDAAIRQAHAETSIIQEAKSYFARHGVNLEAFKTKEYSDRVVLLKNFSYGLSVEDIRKLFESFGKITRLLVPPSATIAIVELENAAQAGAAFRALAYRKLKDSVLLLEKAPKSIFAGGKEVSMDAEQPRAQGDVSAVDLMDSPDTTDPNSGTLFVRNLNFSTTTEQLRDLFKPLAGFLSARVKTRTESRRPGEILSMGFGFVEFRSKEEARSALNAMNGHRLEGHTLVIKESHKPLDAGEERRRNDDAKKVASRGTKLIIKNLPFEASKKDVRALLAPYGQLRSVRVPKKFDSSTRGFAFAAFVTAREAESALNMIQGTHFLGRRLNLEFAAEDTVDPEEEIEKMQAKIGEQTEKVALQEIAGSKRRKFAIQPSDIN